MAVDNDKIDDAALALLYLTCTMAIVPGKVLTGTCWVDCTRRA